MQNKFLTALILGALFCFSSYAQNEKKKQKKEQPKVVIIDSIVKTNKSADPLSPTKASFYSAILPGLGQAYNKKYWKIPIIYAALGTGIYFYLDNDKEYNRYRDAYKRRLSGFTDDEFYFDSQGNRLETPRISTERLEDAQKFLRKNKEISLLVTIGLYALNIIDANVDAHLLQYNIDENLSLSPHYELNPLDAVSHLGLTLNLKF